jgi:type VI secretion system protein ImpA
MVTVQSLDDMVPVILPLNYAPLFEHRHAGPVSYRSYLLAEGEVAPRGEEEKLDIGAIKRAFAEVDSDILIERRDQFRAIDAALARIRTAFVEAVGLGEAVVFARLVPLSQKILALLDAHIGARHLEPATTQVGDGVGEGVELGVVPGNITSLADVRAALEAIAAYYESREPSNPALLLVRQSAELVGKSFIDALRVLVPSYFEEVKVQIGKAHVFDLPIERLAEFSSVADIGGGTAVDPATFEVVTRDTALQLLKQISAFYHVAEPSSPVPYLVDRARELAGRDFLGLLREMLPKDTLGLPEGK